MHASFIYTYTILEISIVCRDSIQERLFRILRSCGLEDSPESRMDYINHIIKLLEKNRAIVQDIRLDHVSLNTEDTSLCYLCLNLIEDSAWRIWEVNRHGKSRYDFHAVCYHSLLAMAGYSESNVSQSIDRNQRILQLLHYKNPDFPLAHWNYSMNRKV